MGTYTGAYTYSRYSLLELQVKYLLDEAGEASASAMAKLSYGLSQQYFKVVGVQGLYENGDKGAEIRVIIDWRQHNLLIGTGGEKVRAPKNWGEKGISPTIKEVIKTFNAACNEAGLEKRWYVIYDSIFNGDELDKELGFKTAKTHKWRYAPESAVFDFGPLEEMKIEVNFAID